MLNSFGKNTAAAVHTSFYNRHCLNCKMIRTQVWPFIVWPFIACTHRKGWGSIVLSSINVNEFIFMSAFFWHVKEKIWWRTVFKCRLWREFLVIYIIWSTSFELAVQVVEGGIVGHIEAISNLSWHPLNAGTFCDMETKYQLHIRHIRRIWYLIIRYSHTYH